MLDKRNLYRFPWSLNDNPIAWLEVTDICNMYCEGCYRQHMTGHKSLEEIKEEILMFKRWRNPDNVSIAGGEPLIHPQIDDVVAFIAENKIKPVILTNGMALTRERLRDLKKAGLSGFTIHIDSHQKRPHWEGKNEEGLNELRQHFADMIAAEGGLYVIFNSTVYPSSYLEIPDVVRWGRENIDRVHGLVFITYRTATTDDHVGRDVKDSQVDLKKLSYVTDHFDEKFVTSPEVYQIIKDNFPEYEAAGYLGGTVRHDSIKWLAGAQVGAKGRVYGSIGKRTMELAQVGHHIFAGTYLAYMSHGKVGSKIFALAPFDPILRQAWRNRLKDVIRHPGRLFDGINVQTIGIIQAPDLQTDGRADMCDSCPDITIYNGQFINSCRMDEYRLFDGFLTVTKKEQEAEQKRKEEALQAEADSAGGGDGERGA